MNVTREQQKGGKVGEQEGSLRGWRSIATLFALEQAEVSDIARPRIGWQTLNDSAVVPA